MRIKDRVIPWIIQKDQPAFVRMQRLYAAHPRLSFAQDFADYAMRGYVRISPTAMAFARPCHDEEGDYWFIRSAIGPLAEVMGMLPYHLPRIAWCRNDDGVIRIWKTDRLKQLVELKQKEQE